MARVTVEDCTKIIPSRFELVTLAAHRAKSISAGGEITVERDNDKNAVIALREIAEQSVNIEKLRELVVQGCQEKVHVDEYGVEQAVAGEDVGLSSDEITEDISSYQEQNPDQSADSLLYSEDNLDDISD